MKTLLCWLLMIVIGGWMIYQLAQPVLQTRDKIETHLNKLNKAMGD